MIKNKGLFLEFLINKTNNFYENQNLAFFRKRNIPLIPFNVHKNKRNLKTCNAIIKNKSDVDYFGIYKGRFIAFEAKSTDKNIFNLANIKVHQRSYIQKVISHQGIAFYIIAFLALNKYFLVTDRALFSFGKKSISPNDIKRKGYEIKLEYPGYLDFLSIIKKFLL